MSSRWELEAQVEDRLAAAGVPSPDVDARLLLDVIEERFGDPTRCETAILDGMVERRIARVPLQVILGTTTFRWVDLIVEAGVFVPRPETEIVAGLAIDAVRGIEAPLIAEPCTGTGAITCAILSEVPGVKVFATDLSAAAVDLARRNGSAIAIGHPHPTTVRVLQQMVYNLPSDITLVRPSSLLNEPQVDTSTPNRGMPPSLQPTEPRNPFRGVKLCKPKKPLEPVYASRFFNVLSESITHSTLVQYMQLQWQGWQNS